MRDSMTQSAQLTFDELVPELSVYLAQRFASNGFAEKIIHEARKRLDDGEILSLVGDVRVYLCSFAMGIGKQLLEDEYLKACH
ncbi:hypothetical protein [Cellvibrio sp. PSBB023]|uniref:hypothetical protein n=1 Tax=Cellvibrio sp. PSBB023 TaxID=1945512 RepID=UPI00098F4DBC|nr:hypothetical protein [Cellvibrio sp. PSBB023]AQT59598.1 hypothetical protein B0D95_05465 [Cellvibrio sp. PSBB023]